MKKRILAVVMALVMTIGLLPEMNYAQEATNVATPSTTAIATTDASAIDEATGTAGATPENGTATDANNTYKTGLIRPGAFQLDIPDAEIDESGTIDSTGVLRVASDWDKYESNYYYNLMSQNEKDFYDALDGICYTYLTTPKDVPYYDTNYKCAFDVVANNVLTHDDAMKVLALFQYSNPQYYFLRGSSYITNNLQEYVLIIYPKFMSGTTRIAETKAFKDAIGASLSQIRANASGSVTVEQAVHDWIANKVTYDPNYNSMSNDDFNTYELASGYTQSSYSVFCKSDATTVCAGYSQAFELLCNALGIETIAVTSKDHEWNRVRLNGSWYNVDCTWDDLDGKYGKTLFYLLYNRNYSKLSLIDPQKHHDQEDIYDKYMTNESCTADSKPTKEDDNSIGIIQPAKGTAATPTVSVDASGKLSIANGDAGAKFYYTKDGTNPSVSTTKCYSYDNNSSETLNSTTLIKAIAVHDGYIDSSVATVNEGINTVTFNSNGGSVVTSQSVATGNLLTQPAKPTRSGYTFMGWYKDTAYASAWNFATDTVAGNITLFARWGRTYKIKYNLNGGTQNKLNPSKYTPITATFTLQKPTRKGYTFGGWYKNQQLSSAITKVKKGTKGNLTLYAKWKKVNVAKGTIKTVKNKTGKKMEVAVAKVSGAAGYQIKYSTKSNMKSAKSLKVTTTSTIITGLSKKTYYVQIRPYKLDSMGNKVYGSWSNTKSVKIKR